MNFQLESVLQERLQHETQLVIVGLPIVRYAFNVETLGLGPTLPPDTWNG
jgi:hypothetical protein